MGHQKSNKEDNNSDGQEAEAGHLPMSLQKKGLATKAVDKEFAATLDQLLANFRSKLLAEHARCMEGEGGGHGEWVNINASGSEGANASPRTAESASEKRPRDVPKDVPKDVPPIKDKSSSRETFCEPEGHDLKARVARFFHAMEKHPGGLVHMMDLRHFFKAEEPGVAVDDVIRATAISRNPSGSPAEERLSFDDTVQVVEHLTKQGLTFHPPEESAYAQIGILRKRKSKAERVTLSHDPNLARKIHSEKVKVSRMYLMQRLQLELDLVNVFKQIFAFIVYVLPFWLFILLVSQPVDIADAHRMLTAHYGVQPTALAAITEWSQVYSFMKAFAESNDLLQATGKVYWCDPRFLQDLGLNDQGRAEYQRQAELQAQVSGAYHRRLASSSSGISASSTETLEEKLLRLKLAYQNPTPLGVDAEGHNVNLYDCTLPSNYELLTMYHALQDVERENTTVPVTDYGNRRRHRRLGSSTSLSTSNSTNFTYKASEVGPKAEYQWYYPQYRQDYINYNVKTHSPEAQHYPETSKYLPRYRYPYRQLALLDPLVYQRRITPVVCSGMTFSAQYASQTSNPDAPFGMNAPKATDILDCYDKNTPATAAVATDIDTDGYDYKDDKVYARFAYQSGDHTGGQFDDWQRIGWLDKLTQDVTISALVYTQDIELFTMVTVQFDQGAGGGVHATIKLESLVDFDSGGVNPVFALGSISAIFATMAFAHSLATLRYRRRELGASCSLKGFLTHHGNPVLLFETFSRLSVIIFLLFYLLMYALMPAISSEFDDVLHKFLDLHDFSHAGLHGAIQDVFHVKELIDGNAAFERQMGFVCAVVFLIQSFQLIMYVSVHPRLGVLMSTMVRTVDDILHFLILFGTIFGLLGFFSHFTFAAVSPDEFGTVSRALGKQFELIIGYGDDWPWRAFDNMTPLASIMFQMYVFCFVLLVFFVMINFFVGIVLQGFFDTKKAVEDLNIENSFWSDMTDVPLTFWHFSRTGWPKRKDTLRFLRNAGDHPMLAPADLVRYCGFPDTETAFTFMEYYGVKIPVLLEEADPGAS